MDYKRSEQDQRLWWSLATCGSGDKDEGTASRSAGKQNFLSRFYLELQSSAQIRQIHNSYSLSDLQIRFLDLVASFKFSSPLDLQRTAVFYFFLSFSFQCNLPAALALQGPLDERRHLLIFARQCVYSFFLCSFFLLILESMRVLVCDLLFFCANARVFLNRVTHVLPTTRQQQCIQSTQIGVVST